MLQFKLFFDLNMKLIKKIEKSLEKKNEIETSKNILTVSVFENEMNFLINANTTCFSSPILHRTIHKFGSLEKK